MKKSLLIVLLGAMVSLGACSSSDEMPMPSGEMRGEGRMQRMKMMPPSVDKVFEKEDANSDGKISKEEFLKHKAEREEVKAQKRAEKADDMFEKMDANKDGFVTKEEMENHRKNCPMKPRKNRRK